MYSIVAWIAVEVGQIDTLRSVRRTPGALQYIPSCSGAQSSQNRRDKRSSVAIPDTEPKTVLKWLQPSSSKHFASHYRL